MIVAHLSDLHLGHRAFARSERGQNVRERDLAVAFQRAVEAVIEESPDLVLISGDVFDRPDPPPSALVALTRGLEALHSALPGTRVLMVGGARDTPRRTEDAGALAALDAFPNVDAAADRARTVLLSRHSAQIVLLPYRSALLEPRPAPEPDPRRRWNLVVAHGRVAQGRLGVPLDDERWSYLALGGLHSFRKVGDRAAYAGALERVGPAPWDEAAEEKGFVVADLSTRSIRFRPVPGRPVVDLAPTRVPPGDSAALQARILEVTREVPGGIEGKIVRIRLKGPNPDDVRGLQPGFLAGLADQALHLALDFESWEGVTEPPLSMRERALANLSSEDDRARALLERVLAGANGSLP
ncbi:MAG: metallophosphoesterase [Gemmatimonadales bacterium]|jgi:DNA repair exonuclease SbcCD nuclease subunit|nr:MAG: metallophosphoesterase [Gemmatimonadales bacterium]